MSSNFPEAEYKDGLLEFKNKEDAKKAAHRLNTIDPSTPGYTDIIANYFSNKLKNMVKGTGLDKIGEVFPEYGQRYRHIENAVVPNSKSISENEKQAMKLYSESTSEEELNQMWHEIREDEK